MGGNCGPKRVHEIRRRRRDGAGRGQVADVPGAARHARHAAGRRCARNLKSGFHIADCARYRGAHPCPHHQHHRLQRNFAGPCPADARREAGLPSTSSTKPTSPNSCIGTDCLFPATSMVSRKRTLPWCRRTAASAINFTPRPAGTRWYHTHTMAGADLHRGSIHGPVRVSHDRVREQPGKLRQGNLSRAPRMGTLF